MFHTHDGAHDFGDIDPHRLPSNARQFKQHFVFLDSCHTRGTRLGLCPPGRSIHRHFARSTAYEINRPVHFPRVRCGQRGQPTHHRLQRVHGRGAATLFSVASFASLARIDLTIDVGRGEKGQLWRAAVLFRLHKTGHVGLQP